MALSLIALEGLSPRDKRYQVNITRGLYVRVETNGRKVLFCEMMVLGKRLKRDLGEWPELSLKKAREMADQIKAEYLNSLEKEQTEEPHEKPVTFREVMEDYINFKYTKNPATGKLFRERLTLHVLPFLGDVPLKEIKAPDVISRLRLTEAEGKIYTCKICARGISAILDYAVNYGLIDANPCARIGRVLQNPEHTAMPSVGAERLSELFSYLVRINAGEMAVNYALWSCCSLLRPSENRLMRWDWIDGDVLTVPAEIMKKRREHRVPITAFMSEILKSQEAAIKVIGKRSSFVWPRSGRDEGPVGECWFQRLIKKSPLDGQLTPHGLRSTGRSWMAEHDVPTEVAEACLAHLNPNPIVNIYNRSDYLEKRREAMEKWSEEVRRLWQEASKSKA